MRITVGLLAIFSFACSAAVPPAPPRHGLVGSTRGLDAAPNASQLARGLEPPQPSLRLPKNFAPTSYTVRLAIDPAKTSFEGAIVISGEVAERSSLLWLHGRQLGISHAAATQPSSGRVVELVATPRGEDLLELRSDAPLEPGPWNLALDYRGEIDSVNTTGAFKETVDGATYVYTQLEAIYARRVFPCVDEPDSKVPWQLTLDVPKGVIAVSNTPIEKQSPLPDGGKRVLFTRTKPLPSYLVAFGIGPFDILDAGKTKSGIPIRVFTLKGRSAEAAYAAQTSRSVLEILEDWYAIPYPYEKLDLLTIPLTVGFGAMENAGLITFSERLILIDPRSLSWTRRHRWILVVAHEMAHQWFGNLVTTAYWDDIWLNEGFATWMETKIAARFAPAWHDELGELDLRNSALDADSLESARQIRQPIQSTDDILNVFDGITYDKGASVLNMFESYLGSAVFQRGVSEYLRARAFGTATSADFLAAIDRVSGKNVRAAFATFLDQGGEPQIDVELACDGQRPTLTLHQRRYLPPGSPPVPEAAGWILPVCVVYDRDGERGQACTLLDKAGTLPLDAKKCPRWLMPNANGRGYYRSGYSAAQVTALRDEAWPHLSWTERRAVFYDVAEAARAGGRKGLPLTLGLSLVPKLLAGRDRWTVQDALGLTRSLDPFVPDELRSKYEAWVRRTFSPEARKRGLLPRRNDDLDAEVVRDQLGFTAAWSGRDPELVQQATEAARSWRDLPQSVRGTILKLAVDAGAQLFDEILKDVKTEPDRTRRREMIQALAATRDPKRTPLALGLMLDRTLDLRELLEMGFGPDTQATSLAAERFFRDHKDELLARMPRDEVSNGVAGLAYVFTRACDAARRGEIAEYVTHSLATFPGAARPVAQSIEAMDQCIARRGVLEPQLRAWLGGVNNPTPPQPAAARPNTP